MDAVIKWLSVFFFLVTALWGCSRSHPHSSGFAQFVAEVTEFVDDTADYVAPSNNDAYFEGGDATADPIVYGTYDFIIIGAGAAGGVLASRLSEIAHFSVLVVEAGKTDPSISKVLGLYAYLSKSEYNWGYHTTPQNHSCLANTNRSCPYARGKVLGGSSTINVGFYSRGNPNDYNKWAELTGADWAYEDCLPYFKKSENADFTVDIDPEYHGTHGAQHVNVPEDTAPLSQEYINAFKEMGKKEGDYNGFNQLTVSRPQLFSDYNTRSSTAHSYIHPAYNRTNLNFSLESLVTKISFVNSTATGIEFWKNGTRYIANATKEIILSAGAFNSPQVLMLSGIGPKDHLGQLGIDVIADLPVGENLLDHVAFDPLYYRSKYSFYNNSLEENLKLWYHNHRPLTDALSVDTVTYYNVLENSYDSPDIEVVMHGPPTCSPDYGYNLGLIDSYAKPFEILHPYTDFSVTLFVMQPRSVGSVTLQSSDPRDFPLLNPNYYSDPVDLEIMYKGLEAVLPLNNTEAFRRVGAEPLIIALPLCEEKYQRFAKDWWLCNFQHASYAGLHPCGTTRMGINVTSSVVNGTTLKVHGFENLRVVDAGIFPTIPSAHLNAPVVMVAEKAADIIKSDYSI